MLQVLLQNRTQTQQNDCLKNKWRCIRVHTKLKRNVHVIKECTHNILVILPRQMSHSQVIKNSGLGCKLMW